MTRLFAANVSDPARFLIESRMSILGGVFKGGILASVRVFVLMSVTNSLTSKILLRREIPESFPLSVKESGPSSLAFSSKDVFRRMLTYRDDGVS